MRKKLLITPLCSLAVSGIIQADTTNNDLYLFLGGTSSVTSVSTSMHDAGSAAASYTLGSGSGNSSVQTTSSYSSSDGGGNAAAYSESKYDSPSSSASTGSRKSSGRRGSSAATASGYTPSDSGKGGLSTKGGIPTEAYDPSPLIINVEGGYQSQYVYNGLNRIKLSDFSSLFTRPSSDDTDMYFLGADMKWNGFSVGLRYIKSQASDRDPLFSPVAKSLTYEEYVFDVNYTLGVIAGPQGEGNWLDVTAGYELIYFPEETFWNTDMQHKFYATLKVNRYKWVRPSVSYQIIESGDVLNTASVFPGFDMLSGEQLIFQVDGGGVVSSIGSVEFGVGYYAKAGMGRGYQLGPVLNQNWYEAGINFPVTVGGITVSPSVHYTIHDADALVEEPGLWWGLSAKYTF